MVAVQVDPREAESTFCEGDRECPYYMEYMHNVPCCRFDHNDPIAAVEEPKILINYNGTPQVGYSFFAARNIEFAPPIPSISNSSSSEKVDTKSSCLPLMAKDELYEILSWMPAKSVIKYSSSLCKSLCNIHLESGFVKKQCVHSFGQDNGFFLLPKLESMYGLEFHALPPSSAFGIPSEYVDFLLNSGIILASSNGLLLIACGTSEIEFAVCNPATMTWAQLPTPRGYEFQLGDHFMSLIECYNGSSDSFPNDYTVALLVGTGPRYFCSYHPPRFETMQLLIYSNGRWEEELCDISSNIEGGWGMRYEMPVAIFSTSTNGLIVHYLCERLPVHGIPYSEPFIAAFDIRNKKLLRTIKLPAGAGDMDIDFGYKYRDRLQIFKWNNTSICLVKWYKWQFTVWALEKNRDSHSWRRVLKESEVDILGFGESDVISFGIVGGKSLLIATKTRVFVYGMEGEKRGKLELVGNHGLGMLGGVNFLPYANTLRPVCV